MTPLELMENQFCEQIAENAACAHSPAVPGSHEAAGIHAAEEIAEKIRERRDRGIARLGIPVRLDATIPAHAVYVEDAQGERWLVAWAGDEPEPERNGGEHG